MDNKDTLTRVQKDTTLGSNPDYYKYIFKKTEKIVCAVFYTLRSNKDISHHDVLIKNIEQSAEKVMTVSFSALRATESQSDWVARDLGYTLMELESSLRMAHFGRLLQTDVLNVFGVEIDSVLRSLKTYTDSKIPSPLFDGDGVRVRSERTPRLKPAQAGMDMGMLREGTTEVENKVERTDRILAVLRDKGQASIKDISEVVTDCSEKTIQRELNVLIKDNRIRREGERRWSKYMLF